MPQNPTLLTTSQLLELWLGHRQLTRRVIEAFPEEDFFGFSIGGMRTPSELSNELVQVGGALVHGVATGEWSEFQTKSPHTDKASTLAAWDADMAVLEHTLPQLTAAQLDQDHNAWGFFNSSGRNQLMYAMENEIHHRGQMYVYLRALGIEPPAFYERPMTT